MICDNINSVHDNKIINEEKDGLRFICKKCKQINIIRMDQDGRMDNKNYQRIFKKDTLQPGTNLYYKEYPEQMSVI